MATLETHIAAQAGLQPHLDNRPAVSTRIQVLSSCTESRLYHSGQVRAYQSTARCHPQHQQCMCSSRMQVCLQCSTRAHVGACMHQRQAPYGVCVCLPTQPQGVYPAEPLSCLSLIFKASENMRAGRLDSFSNSIRKVWARAESAQDVSHMQPVPSQPYAPLHPSSSPA